MCNNKKFELIADLAKTMLEFEALPAEMRPFFEEASEGKVSLIEKFEEAAKAGERAAEFGRDNAFLRRDFIESYAQSKKLKLRNDYDIAISNIKSAKSKCLSWTACKIAIWAIRSLERSSSYEKEDLQKSWKKDVQWFIDEANKLIKT